MNCLRIRFVTPNGVKLQFYDDQEISLVITDIELKLKIRIHEIKSHNSIIYSFVSNPFDKMITISETDIQRITNSLYLSSLQQDYGILLDSSLQTGGITTDYKKMVYNQSGLVLDNSFIGVKVVDCNTKYIGVESAILGAKMPIEKFEQALNNYLSTNLDIDNKLIRAIEIFNSTKFISKYNQSARFLLCMVAIECLIEQKKSDKKVIKIVDSAIKKVRWSCIDKQEKQSVKSSLEHLKRESIGRSGRKLIEELFLHSGNKYNDLDPVNFFSKAYDLRSKFVHNGDTETKHFSIYESTIDTFTKDCLKRYYEGIQKKQRS